MTTRLLGIDVAPGEVRIARGERRLGGVRLTDVSRLPLAGETLATILARVGGTRRGAHVLTALPPATVAHRVLSLPFRDRRRLTRTVPLELAGQLAADIQDAVVAFEPVADGSNGTTVLAVAARRSDLDEHAALLATAGLAAARIDLAPLPAWNLVAAHVGDAALVLADGAQSSVSIRRAGRIVALRALGRAASDADAFAAEVRWALAALGEPPATIVLAGADAAAVLGAVRAATREVPVLPIGRVAAARGDDLDACAVAAGLVLGAGGNGIGLRLGGTQASAGSWRTAAALAAAAAVLAVINLGLWHVRLAKRDATLRAAIRSAAAAVLPEAPLAAPRAELEAAVAALGRGDGRHTAGALALLRETSARVPASIQLDLDELVVEPEALRLGGRAPSFDAVEALRRALAASPLLAGVAAEETRASVDGRGVEFRLRAERRTAPGTSS